MSLDRHVTMTTIAGLLLGLGATEDEMVAIWDNIRDQVPPSPPSPTAALYYWRERLAEVRATRA